MPRPVLLGWCVTQYDPLDHYLQQYSSPTDEQSARGEAEAIRRHTDGALKYGVARVWFCDSRPSGRRSMLEIVPSLPG